MTQETLRALLTPRPDHTGELRWRTAVPIVTNIFILTELFQFAFTGAAIVLLTLCTGVWFTEGILTGADARNALEISALVLVTLMAGFALAAILFFGNRYYAVYHLDANGIYHETTRGHDAQPTLLCLQIRPFPVTGPVSSKQTRNRYIPWTKIDRFQNIPSMRVLILRRNRWHMMRLYSPDPETHTQAAQYLTQHLRQT